MDAKFARVVNLARRMREIAGYCWERICSWILFGLELLFYYAPIIRTRIVECFTFYIPLCCHMLPIKLRDNEYMLITSANTGDRERCLVNVFYKYYYPFDIRDFSAIKRKYLQVNACRFNVYKFSTMHAQDYGKRYTLDFMPDDTIKINGQAVGLQLYSADLGTLLSVDRDEKKE